MINNNNNEEENVNVDINDNDDKSSEDNMSIDIDDEDIDYSQKFAIKRYFNSFNPNTGQIKSNILSYLNNKINNKRIIIIIDANYIEKTNKLTF